MTELENPVELSAKNRKIVQEHLEQAYLFIDALMGKLYSKHEMENMYLLRDLRRDINNLLSDIRSSGFDNFQSNKSDLDDFYVREASFISSSENFYQELITSTELRKQIDVFKLQQLFFILQRKFRERIPASDDVIKKFKVRTGVDVVSELAKSPSSSVGAFGIHKEVTIRESYSSGQNMSISMVNGSFDCILEPDNRELAPSLLAGMYNYFNLLEHKYSTNHPEISVEDVYIGDKKWEFEKKERSLIGNIYDNLFNKTITFYTVFKPYDDLQEIVGSVQKKADRIPSGQYLSLCLVGVGWSEDIIKWVSSYFHLRMSLFVYDLGTGSFCFNKEWKSSDRFVFWHNTDKNIPKLRDRLHEVLDGCGHINIDEASKELGLQKESTAAYIKKLLKAGVLVDVGFGEHKYALSIAQSKKE